MLKRSKIRMRLTDCYNSEKNSFNSTRTNEPHFSVDLGSELKHQTDSLMASKAAVPFLPEKRDGLTGVLPYLQLPV